jgi:hypothetical protein
MADIARKTGGDLIPLQVRSGDTVPQAWEQAGKAIRHWVLVDLETHAVQRGPRLLSVRVPATSAQPVASRTVQVPAPAGVRVAFDLEVPPIPQRASSAVDVSQRDLPNRAAAAEEAGQLLLAGVLWHQTREAFPENRRAADKALELDQRFRQSPSRTGRMMRAGQPVPLDVPVKLELETLNKLWTENLQKTSGLHRILRTRKRMEDDPNLLNPPPGDPDLQQIGLGACPHTTVAACVRHLLLNDSATHFFVDAGGTITQLLDLETVVLGTPSEPGAAIWIHLATPEEGTWSFQDPDQRATWSHPRRAYVHSAPDSPPRVCWDLTQAQYNALVPLLHELAQQFEGILPVLPIDLSHRETLAPLLHPHAFRGILNESNYRHRGDGCEGPALQPSWLNERVSQWSNELPSTNLEDWVQELDRPGRTLPIMLRFQQIGSPAVSLLQEIASELPPSEAEVAVQALAQVGDRTVRSLLPGLFSRDFRGLDPSDAGVLSYRLEILKAALTIQADSLLPAIQQLLRRSTPLPPEEELNTEVERTAANALIALAKEKADVTVLRPWLQSTDPIRRSQAAFALLAHGGDEKSQDLRPLLHDPLPWIRLLAARAQGSEGVPTILLLKDQLPASALIRALASIRPNRPVPETLDWYFSLDRPNQTLLSDLFVQWKWHDAVHPLASHLGQVDRATQALLLRTLQGITGRDLGSAQTLWMRWTPP